MPLSRPRNRRDDAPDDQAPAPQPLHPRADHVPGILARIRKATKGEVLRFRETSDQERLSGAPTPRKRAMLTHISVGDVLAEQVEAGVLQSGEKPHEYTLMREVDETDHKPAISCIFLNYNTPDLVIEAVKSLFDKHPKDHCFRVIVVDNGSENQGEVEAEIRKALDGRLKADPDFVGELEWLPLERNEGFAYGMNHGLRHVQDDYAVLCNTDITFQNGAVEHLVETLKENEDACLACPRIMRPNGKDRKDWVEFEPKWKKWLRGFDPWRSKPKLDYRGPHTVERVTGPCMAIDMKAIEEVGYMDERFFFYGEETEWCRRIVGAFGKEVWAVPEAKIVHDSGETTRRMSPTEGKIEYYVSRYLSLRKREGRGAEQKVQKKYSRRAGFNFVTNALAVGATLGLSEHLRYKAKRYWRLWRWHRAGCPETGWGIRPDDFSMDGRETYDTFLPPEVGQAVAERMGEKGSDKK